MLKESKARRKNVAMAWINYKKATDMVQLYSSLSENVQDIRLSPKLHHESHEKLESGISSRRKIVSIS